MFGALLGFWFIVPVATSWKLADLVQRQLELDAQARAGTLYRMQFGPEFADNNGGANDGRSGYAIWYGLGRGGVYFLMVPYAYEPPQQPGRDEKVIFVGRPVVKGRGF